MALILLIVFSVARSTAAGAPESGAAGDLRAGGRAVNEARAGLGTGGPRVPGCARAGGGGATGEAAAGASDVARAIRVLRRSATAAALLEIARQQGVHVCLDGATRLLAYYVAGARVIGLSARLTDAGKVLFLAHELSHVPQHPRYSDNRYFPPQDLILLRRVREAMAEALATRIAWELRTAGFPEVWREKTRTHYGDVAQAFEASILADGPREGPEDRRLDRATRAAFDSWFTARWRREVYDRMTIEHLEHISTDPMGLVPARRFLSHAFLLGIGRLGSQNFLAGTDGPPLDDPVYAGALTADIARRLERVLEEARVSEAPDAVGRRAGAS